MKTMLSVRSWLHRITAPVEVQPASLPFCTKCREGLKRHQRHTVVTFLHQDCEAKS